MVSSSVRNWPGTAVWMQRTGIRRLLKYTIDGLADCVLSAWHSSQLAPAGECRAPAACPTSTCVEPCALNAVCAYHMQSCRSGLYLHLQLAGILGISATAGAKALSHTVSFALILAIVSNLAQYTYWRSTSRTCACVCHLVLLSCCSGP
jgi:hypothetical protein